MIARLNFIISPLMKTSKSFILIAAIMLAGFHTASAQILYSISGSNYFQDFQTLNYSGGGTWDDGVTLLGWHAFYVKDSVIPTTYATRTGANTSGGLASYVPSAIPTADRSLGAAPGTAFGNTMFGVRFINTTEQTLTEMSISFQAELWRIIGEGAKDLVVAYQIGDFAGLNSGIWTDISELTFAAPVTSPAGTALNGTLPENSELLSKTVTGLNWNPGDDLVIRFFQANNSANKGFAIDDFNFSSVPEPSTAVLLIIGLGISALHARRREKR